MICTRCHYNNPSSVPKCLNCNAILANKTNPNPNFYPNPAPGQFQAMPISTFPTGNFSTARDSVSNPEQEISIAELLRSIPEPDPTPVSFYSRVSPALPSFNKPNYGIDRGFFFYTASSGRVIARPLARLGNRITAAIIDWLLLFLLYLILGWLSFSLVGSNRLLLAFNLLDLFPGNLSNVYTRAMIFGASPYVSIILVFGLLYHIALVANYGQTIGHRISNIKVIKTNGNSVDWGSAAIRALYGQVTGIITAVIAAVVSRTLPINDLLLSSLSITISSLPLIGFYLSEIDPARQGLHDKLANTYVVSTHEV